MSIGPLSPSLSVEIGPSTRNAGFSTRPAVRARKWKRPHGTVGDDLTIRSSMQPTQLIDEVAELRVSVAASVGLPCLHLSGLELGDGFLSVESRNC